jgi:hypothetical protein
MIEAALRQGQEWLILAALEDGGWASGIFPGTSWDRLWSTAIILQRLLLSAPPLFAEWVETLRDAAAVLLQEIPTVKYQNPLVQLRVETRVAATLALVLQFDSMTPLLKERAEAWLQQWERRFLNTLRDLPARECDLATSTFAARVLLRGKIIAK